MAAQIPLGSQNRDRVPRRLMTSKTETFEPCVTLENPVPGTSCSYSLLLYMGKLPTISLHNMGEILGVRDGERHQPSKGHRHPSLEPHALRSVSTEMRLGSL